jgi:hypothetical protein
MALTCFRPEQTMAGCVAIIRLPRPFFTGFYVVDYGVMRKFFVAVP